MVYLRGTPYAQEYGWDHAFEPYVAGPLARFAQSHSERERIWLVDKDEVLAGCMAIVVRG